MHQGSPVQRRIALNRRATAFIPKVALACALVALAGGAVHAQGYPTKPIRLVVPFTPGGGVDINARLLAPKLTEYLGQPIIVESRPGAGTNIGNEYVAKSAPDGYTLLINSGPVAINMALYKNLNYDSLRDFVAISLFSESPNVLVVHPSLPVKTAKDLVAFAKARPGQLNFGSAGPGSVNRLDMEIFMKLAGVKMVHVPYKGGAGQAVAGLVSGEVATGFVTLSSAVGFIKDKRLRALGVVAPQRIATVSDVPTLAEQGFPSMTSGSWQGVLVPAATPRPIVDRLFRDVNAVMALADTREKLDRGGVSVVTSKSPEDFGAFLKRESSRWGGVVKEQNIVAD